MELSEKLNMLEDLFDRPEGFLKEDTPIEVLEIDSINILAIIMFFKDNFDKVVEIQTINEFKTVGDIVQLMNK